MQSTTRPSPRLDALTEVMRRTIYGHPMLTRVREGAVSRREYTLLLWGLRCWHLPIEQTIWDSRVEAVVAVRGVVPHKVPLLERDLVSICGKQLVVPAELNRLIDGLTSGMARGATPARILGRLFVFESLAASFGDAAPRLAAELSLADSATHYVRAAHGRQAAVTEVSDAFAAALAGEVPLQNALEGARELFGQAHELLDGVVRQTMRQAAAS